MKVFMSYSHRDEEVRDRLHVHLAGMKREELIEAWYDREILGGDDFDQVISDQLEDADLFLLLITPDFINSNYCIERELSRALERHHAGTARVIPIIAEPCDWKSLPSLKGLKALPKDGKPISEWVNANNAFVDIVEELRRIVAASPGGTSVQIHPKETTIPKYRVKRDFDEIDRSDFREEAFNHMKSYFERALKEIDGIEGVRGRFTDLGSGSFGATLVKQTRTRSGTAHLTVHLRHGAHSFGDMFYSFSENAPRNTANGGFMVKADDYELFLEASVMGASSDPGRLDCRKAAEFLWQEFIGKAGIDHA